MGGGGKKGGWRPWGAKKKKAVDQVPKSQLVAYVQKKTKTALSKDSIIYETISLDSDGADKRPYLSTVTISALGDATPYQGEQADSKKDAEHAAARAALTSLGVKVPKTTKSGSVT